MELDVVDRTSCTQPLRYDSNQSSTASFRPYDVFSLCRSVSWSTLSNAADRLRSVSIAKLPESRVSSMSLRTLSKAVFVEWCARYAD